jgi:membrane-associated phospholipid phosphatase
LKAASVRDARIQLGWAIVSALLLLGQFPGAAQAQGLSFRPVAPAARQPEAFGGQSGGLRVPQSHRSGILFELRDDFKFIAGDRTFYILTASLLAAPLAGEDLFEQEPTIFHRSWANNATADGVFEAGDWIGNGLAPAGASLVLYTTGKLARKPGVTALASDLIRAHAINALLTHAIKRTVNRARPDGSPYSYPSGHTSSAFAAAGVIAHEVGSKWGLVAYGGALFVGVSRLQENVHFASDVVAGAILGTYVASAINQRQERAAKLSWAPWSNGRATGARLSLSLP